MAKVRCVNAYPGVSAYATVTIEGQGRGMGMLTLYKAREPAESYPYERTGNDTYEVGTMCDTVGVAFVV